MVRQASTACAYRRSFSDGGTLSAVLFVLTNPDHLLPDLFCLFVRSFARLHIRSTNQKMRRKTSNCPLYICITVLLVTLMLLLLVSYS